MRCTVNTFLAVPLVVLLMGSSLARAYELEETERGAVIHWAVDEVTYRLNERGCAELGVESYPPVRASFEVWDQEACLPFRFVDGGLTAAEYSEYEAGDPPGREVLVVWREHRDEWPHSATAVAMTTLVYEVESGRLVDADIELNGAGFVFAHAPRDDGIARGWDIANTMTHEIGHVVGLDHSSDQEATMFASALVGETKKRSLEPDDRAGLCAIYEGREGGGGGGGGCSAGPKAVGAGRGLLLLLLLLLPLLLLAGHRWRWILGSFLLLVLPSPVLAWEIYTTEATGAPLRWFQEEVPYAIDENTPAALPREAALAAIEASFVSWDAVDCATLTLRHEGRLPDLRQEVFALARERNAVIFVEEDWPDSTTAVALTWMTYHLRTGAMRDADILLNAEHMAFTVSPAAVAGRHDLQNTVTHEVGHFLGLGHSALPEATMAPEAPPGETRKRDLHADDRAGLCFLYPPPAADALAADTEDTHGGEADRGAERESAADGAGCALAMAPGRGAGTAGALLASLALLLGVCRSFLLRPRRADIVRSAGSDR